MTKGGQVYVCMYVCMCVAGTNSDDGDSEMVTTRELHGGYNKANTCE